MYYWINQVYFDANIRRKQQWTKSPINPILPPICIAIMVIIQRSQPIGDKGSFLSRQETFGSSDQLPSCLHVAPKGGSVSASTALKIRCHAHLWCRVPSPFVFRSSLSTPPFVFLISRDLSDAHIFSGRIINFTLSPLYSSFTHLLFISSSHSLFFSSDTSLSSLPPPSLI